MSEWDLDVSEESCHFLLKSMISNTAKKSILTAFFSIFERSKFQHKEQNELPIQKYPTTEKFLCDTLLEEI